MYTQMGENDYHPFSPRFRNKREPASLSPEESEEEVGRHIQSHVIRINSSEKCQDAFHASEEKTRYRNIYVTLASSCVIGLFVSLAVGSIFDTFVFLVFDNENKWVGYVEGAGGIVTLIVAVPVGLLVDIWDRALISKISGVFFILSCGVGAYGIWFYNKIFLFLFIMSVSLTSELAMSSGGALFTDSIRQSERVKYFTRRGVVSAFAFSAGPLLSWIYFIFFGNEWKVEILRVPLTLAIIILSPISAFLLFLYRNISLHTVNYNHFPQSDEDVEISERPLLSLPMDFELQNFAASHETNSNQKAVETSITPRFEKKVKNTNKGLPANLKDNLSYTEEEIRLLKLSAFQNLIPYIILGSDILRAIGAGMMVKFLPLFFKKDYNYLPAQIAALYFAQTLTVAFFMRVAQSGARFIGRAWMSFLASVIGLGCLVALIFVKLEVAVVLLFLFRGGVQNSNDPLDRSMIMDYTRSKHRGKWNSVSSLGATLWSGSAVLGGLIADKRDYRYVFFITSICYAVALIAYIPVLFLLPADDSTLLDKDQNYKQNEEPLKTPPASKDKNLVTDVL